MKRIKTMQGPLTRDIFKTWRECGAVVGNIRAMVIEFDMDADVPSICVEGFGQIQIDVSKMFPEVCHGRSTSDTDSTA